MIELKPDPHGYDNRYALILKGSGPMGEGVTLKLSLGEEICCGRSRHCAWSLKRTPAFLMSENGERERLRRSIPWRATSRRHCRIAYVAPDMVEVINHSTNGTFVDGHRVDRIVLTDCRSASHRIQLGANGVVLELHPGTLPDLPRMPAERGDARTTR